MRIVCISALDSELVTAFLRRAGSSLASFRYYDSRHPDDALLPEVAANIMFYGMEHGTFTGLGLLYFFNGKADDPVGARRIINGTDHADDIAAIHRSFLAALS